jgi:hypothetical protein
MRAARRARAAAAAAIAVALIESAPASAQSAADGPTEPTAAELIKAGAAAAASGQYEVCARAYAAALEKELSHATAGELGVCEEALGRNLVAYDHLWYALGGEVRAAPAPVRAQWARFRKSYERVMNRVARVFVSVMPNHAEVLLDGRSLGTQVDGHTFAVLPGAHVWTARLPGRADITVVQTGRGGDMPDVSMHFPLLDEAQPPSAQAPAGPGPAPEPARVIVLDPLEPPCAAAGGERMSPKLCNLFEEVYDRRVNPVISVALGGLVSAGFTADVGPGFYAGVGLHWNDKQDMGFVLFGEVHTLLPTKGGTYGGVPFGAIETLDIAAVTGAVVPCFRYKWVLGCAVVDGGMTIASGSGIAEPGPHIQGMLELGSRLGIDLPIAQRFGVRAFAELRFSPLGPDAGYSVNGKDAWVNPPVSGLFGLGVSFK